MIAAIPPAKHHKFLFGPPRSTKKRTCFSAGPFSMKFISAQRAKYLRPEIFAPQMGKAPDASHSAPNALFFCTPVHFRAEHTNIRPYATARTSQELRLIKMPPYAFLAIILAAEQKRHQENRANDKRKKIGNRKSYKRHAGRAESARPVRAGRILFSGKDGKTASLPAKERPGCSVPDHAERKTNSRQARAPAGGILKWSFLRCSSREKGAP